MVGALRRTARDRARTATATRFEQGGDRETAKFVASHQEHVSSRLVTALATKGRLARFCVFEKVTFAYRPEYRSELGNTIANFLRMLPNGKCVFWCLGRGLKPDSCKTGLLIFFPSYTLMEQTIEYWQADTCSNKPSTWQRMMRSKKLLVEPRRMTDFQVRFWAHGLIAWALLSDNILL